jgi:hypothetical protein
LYGDLSVTRAHELGLVRLLAASIGQLGAARDSPVRD